MAKLNNELSWSVKGKILVFVVMLLLLVSGCASMNRAHNAVMGEVRAIHSLTARTSRSFSAQEAARTIDVAYWAVEEADNQLSQQVISPINRAWYMVEDLIHMMEE